MPTPNPLIDGLRVLVVEDEAPIAAILADQLQNVGCQVIGVVDNGPGAIDIATELRPDLILMDVHLRGDMDGIEAAERIHRQLAVPVVYLTASSDDSTLQRAKAASAYGYVLKPFYFKGLVVAIEFAVHRFRTEQRLEQSRLTYASILASVSDAVITTDVAARVQFMNGAAERLTGCSLEHAQGQQANAFLRITTSAGEDTGEDLVSGVLTSKAAVTLNHGAFVVGTGSRPVPVEGGAAPVSDGLGRLVGTTVTLRDASEARNAQAKLQAMAERLRIVVDSAVDGVMLLDNSGMIEMFNPACERLFGYAAGEVLGCGVELLMPSPFVDDYGRPLQTLLSTPPGLPFIKNRVTHGRSRSGAVFPAELSVGEVACAGHSGFVAVVHDLTERQELQAAVFAAIGSEQRRFGRDLHDGLGQDLTGLAFLLEALARRARRDGLPIVDDLEQAGSVARYAIEACRGIAHGLSPIADAQGGLIAGLRDLVGRLRNASGPQIEFSSKNVDQLGLAPATTEHLFRIAQEALSNALKHSNATAISVTLEVSPTEVRLEICDDGDGLREAGSGTSGLGLRTMRYRAAMIGARFAVTPNERAGTCVVCECPKAA